MSKTLPRLILTLAALVIPVLYAGDGLSDTPEARQLLKQSAKKMSHYLDGAGEVFVGGVLPITPEEASSIPLQKIARKQQTLPVSHNNINSTHLRPVFSQAGYSCAQAGGIGYHYTYALAEANGLDVTDGDRDNIYSYFYSWSFFNKGLIDGGSSFRQGWKVGNTSGLPPVNMWEPEAEYRDNNDVLTWWMSGYSRYFEILKNRFVEEGKIAINTIEGINDLKQWIYDFGDGSPVGGMATFSVQCTEPMWNANWSTAPTGTPEAGAPVVAGFGASGGHVMNIFGWHDSVRYDVNGDGRFTNDVDITMDGVVDVKDWEKGAWYILNSWGYPRSHDQNGCFYMLYRTAALGKGSAYADDTLNRKSDYTVLVRDSTHLNNGGLSSGKHVYTIRGIKKADNIKQALTYKINFRHDKRDCISFLSGVSNNVNDARPEFTKTHLLFNHQGGPFNAQGLGRSSQIEIGLDEKELLDHVDSSSAKFFLMIPSRDTSTSGNQITGFSLMDYRGGSLVEVPCDQTPVTLTPGDTAVLSVVYNAASAPLNIQNETLPKATVLQNYSQQLQGTGGASPYKWELKKNVYYEAGAGNQPWQINTEITPNDTDDAHAEVVLGFDFPFFGQNYRTLYLLTDGVVMFDENWQYVRNLENLKTTEAIAAMGADYVISEGDHMYFEGDATKAVIRWHTTHKWTKDGLVDINADFGLILYPSGRIEYYYGSGLTGDIPDFAAGVSNGEGNFFSFDYGGIENLPDNHKAAVIMEPELKGLSLSESGLYSGIPTGPGGDYRLKVTLTDALEVAKTKILHVNVHDPAQVKRPSASFTSPLTVKNTGRSLLFAFGTSLPAHAVLEAYSITGQKIQTIFDGRLQAGRQSLVWEFGSGSMVQVPEGLYLCKLTLDGKSVVKRVSIFK